MPQDVPLGSWEDQMPSVCSRPVDVARRCLVHGASSLKDAGMETAIGNHSFRAIGITDYL
jgi:hypothetical protein